MSKLEKLLSHYFEMAYGVLISDNPEGISELIDEASKEIENQRTGLDKVIKMVAIHGAVKFDYRGKLYVITPINPSRKKAKGDGMMRGV